MSENLSAAEALHQTAPPPARRTTREEIRTWIEEATGEGLSVDDPLPDTLAAEAEAAALERWEVRCWIYDQPKPDHGWSGAALAAWARAKRLSEARA